MSKWRGVRMWQGARWEAEGYWGEAAAGRWEQSKQASANHEWEASAPVAKGKGKSSNKGAGKGWHKARGNVDSDKVKDLPVAIIGGGLSGLACGWALRQFGVNAVVFDTGKHGPGGRASSRLLEIGGCQHVVDHAVQAFTAQGTEVCQLVNRMEKKGVVRHWTGVVGTLTRDGNFSPRDEATQGPLWIGGLQDGIGAIPAWLAEEQDVQRDVWVSRLQSLDSGAWSLLNSQGKPVGHHAGYSYVVMAHNGKCADRLIKTAPFMTDVHSALRCRFTPQASQSSDRLELSSLFVCVVEVPSGIAKFEGAFIEKHQTLSWAGNNSCKYPPKDDAARATDLWTLVSTPQYGTDNKCPQENIPPQVREKVSREMCEGFAALIGADARNWQVAHLQLWGAALPLNVCGQHFVHDPKACIGVCGDWLSSPSVEGALFSGLALAEAIQRDLRIGGLKRSGVQRFRGLADSHALGSFGLCDAELTAAGAVDAIVSGKNAEDTGVLAQKSADLQDGAEHHARKARWQKQ
jgi:predicted NAD/FAD-dependent oxidoreductase